MFETEKWMNGYYRVHAPEHFAGIRKHGDGWHVEIRYNDGTLKRYAGIHKTLKVAKEEAEWVLARL